MTPPRIRRAWLALIAFTVVLRLPALVHPRAIDDETIYAVVAHEIVEGGKPYVDAIERKPPLLFWTYALVLELSGKYNWPALHATATVWVLLTMFGVYIVTRRLFDPAAGLAAAFLYSLYQPWATWKNLALNGEVLMNLPIAWALVLTLRPVPPSVSAQGAGRERKLRSGEGWAWRPELGLAGALLAAGFLLKQPAAIAVVPVGIYLLLPAYRRAQALRTAHCVLHASLFTLGFAITLAITAAILRHQGILEEAVFWTISHHDTPHGPTDPVFWLRGGRMTLAFIGGCAPLVIGAALALRPKLIRASALWEGREAELQALALLLVASAIGTAASGRFYPHYYIQLVLPLAILAGPVIRDTGNGGVTGTQRVLLAAWLALTAIGFLAAHSLGLARQRAPTEVGGYVREHADPNDRILVWGQGTGIYLDARRRPATRYVATFPLTGYIFGSPLSWHPGYDTSHRIVPGAWDNFAADVARHPPAYIVDQEAVRDVPRYPADKFPVLRNRLAGYDEVFVGTEGAVYKLRGGR